MPGDVPAPATEATDDPDRPREKEGAPVELMHEFLVPAGPDETWALLTDPEQVGRCLPGATVTATGKRTFSGSLTVNVSPLAVTYAGSGRFLRRDERKRTAVVEAEGDAVRGDGTVSARVTLRLVPDGPSTRAVVRTELEVTGKPAQLSESTMQDVADQLVAKFLVCVAARLAPPAAEEPAGPQQQASRAVLPALARSGGYVAAALVGVLVGVRLGRPRAGG